MEVRDYIALADNLCTERAAFEGGWDEMRRIIMPRATGNAHPDSVPDNGGGLEHSDVANNSLKKLASAHLTYITLGQAMVHTSPRWLQEGWESDLE